MNENNPEADRNPRGLIYIIQNDMHAENVYKVGETSRTVEDRIKGLNRETGNPGKFNILASFPVSDRKEAEKACFKELQRQGFTKINKKEFFQGPWDGILCAVEKIAAQFQEMSFVNPPKQSKKKPDVETYYRGFSIHRVSDGWLVPNLKFEDSEQVYGNIEVARLVIDRELK
jgi:hypothetical protein